MSQRRTIVLDAPDGAPRATPTPDGLKIQLTADQTAQYFEQVMLPVITANSQRILEVWLAGAIPVVVIETDGLSKVAHKAARMLGWNCKSTVFAARRDLVLKAVSRYPGQRAWASQQPTYGGAVHVWVWHGPGNLMLCKAPGDPWYIAPGTLDCEILD
jgi:hypothetical protein